MPASDSDFDPIQMLVKALVRASSSGKLVPTAETNTPLTPEQKRKVRGELAVRATKREDERKRKAEEKRKRQEEEEMRKRAAAASRGSYGDRVDQVAADINAIMDELPGR